jgi:putative selenate reductase
MSDTMQVQPFELLLNWILKEYESNQSVFGIHHSLFYTPKADSPYAVPDLFGHYLAAPIGPGAGPHTQLAQNILCAWLSGGRFIELKTVQIMDELEIPRPCIDMEDEGYNVEWSQELKLEQSASEYVKAWALIHVLRRLLGFEHLPFGTIFNMSVGYNLEGIQSPPVTRFMDRLQDASEEIAAIQTLLRIKFPQFGDIEIPTRVTDNVTLSTMHGCPPDEIERIARYLLEERGLHTSVKLNPTLLGKEVVMRILYDHLGFREIHIPDRIFEHDLQYGRAVALIKTLQKVAAGRGLTFGLKLSNTLAMANHKGALPGGEMYMSGRALYPLTINLFHKLSQDFGGDPSSGPSTPRQARDDAGSGRSSGQALNVSFSAGADAFNLTGILAAGARPVTTVTDLLKPGGYSRLLQYLENLEKDMERLGAKNLEELARNRLANLEREAARVLEDPRYKKAYHPYGLPKVESKLGLFDCITAPCVEQCAVRQDVPEYAWLIGQKRYDEALEVILSRNPLPGVTGCVCNHLCQTRCTRNNYDEPVAIRALKRFAAEEGKEPQFFLKNPVSEVRVAVIGSGPSGLAAACFLTLNGLQVTVYEARDRAGGMLAWAIPTFRLPEAIVQEDIARIKELGVQIELSHPITTPPQELFEKGFDAVYIASGAGKSARLRIEGEEGIGVYEALDFLDRARRGERVDLGHRVLVIGGGNSAMDAARTARRIASGPVRVVYRRTRQEMPAIEEEVEEVLAEGITLEELASPARIILKDGRVAALECVRNQLGEAGEDGRRKPIPVVGSEFEIEADAIIVAIGQVPGVSFLGGSTVSLRKNGTIAADPQTGLAGRGRVYAGGDAVRGLSTIIEAIADGKRAAEAICQSLGIEAVPSAVVPPQLSEEELVALKRTRARKELQNGAQTLPLEQRGGFDLVEETLAEEVALSEAARCLQCSTLCDKCVEVCPNRANYAFLISPVSLVLPKVSCQQGRFTVTGEDAFRIGQPRQIIHVDDFCNECGNCETFCVHDGKPYLDKPRLFLREGDFEQEEDNAFYIERGPEGWAIRRREGGKESRLAVEDGGDAVLFENELLKIRIALPDFQIEAMEMKKDFQGEFSLAGPAEMYVVLKGLATTLSFLPFEETTPSR